MGSSKCRKCRLLRARSLGRFLGGLFGPPWVLCPRDPAVLVDRGDSLLAWVGLPWLGISGHWDADVVRWGWLDFRVIGDW